MAPKPRRKPNTTVLLKLYSNKMTSINIQGVFIQSVPSGLREDWGRWIGRGKESEGMEDTKESRSSRHNSVGTRMSSQTLWWQAWGLQGLHQMGLKEVETSPMSNPEDISNWWPFANKCLIFYNEISPGYKPLLRVDIMPSGIWPTYKELIGIFEGSFVL